MTAARSSKGVHVMSVKQISPGVYQISPSISNVYLIDSDELILVDVGDPKSANAIQKAVQSIGKQMTDIRHILLTHCHRDHAGGLAKIKQMTGAPVYMHPIEATAVRKGETRREFFKPAPGLIPKIIVPILTGPLAHGNGIEPADVENEVQDGDVLCSGSFWRTTCLPLGEEWGRPFCCRSCSQQFWNCSIYCS